MINTSAAQWIGVSGFVGLVLFPLSAFAFSDVSSSYPYKDAIDWVQSQNIVSGYADGTFRPNNTINRAEFVKIVVGTNFRPGELILCDPHNIYSFGDASMDAWYSKYLCLAVQHHVISGYNDNTFRPEQPINAAEAAKIIAIASSRNSPKTLSFEPANNQQWFEPYMAFLKDKNAIPPSITSNDTLLTRGEMTEMMYRLKSGSVNHAGTGWKTYEDTQGKYTLQLPETWKAISGYDGSYLNFEKLEDGVMGYGNENGTEEIFLMSYRKEDVHLQPNETLLEFVKKGTVGTLKTNTSSYPVDDYTVYNISFIDPPKEYKIKNYALFVRDDVIVVFGYGISSTGTETIKQSFKFIPKGTLK